MKIAYLILMTSLVASPALADGLPDLGDVSATVLSPLEEQRIAEQIMKDVMSSGQVVSDPEVVDYVHNLGYRLAANGPDRRQQFYFFVDRKSGGKGKRVSVSGDLGGLRIIKKKKQK